MQQVGVPMISGIMARLGMAEWATIILFLVGGFVLVVSLFGWLWNITIPSIFGWRRITFWESFRLLLLASMLTGRFFNFSWTFR